MKLKKSLDKKLFLLFALTFFLFTPLALAQNSFDGKIISTSVSPQQIYASQHMSYTIDMQNTGNQANSYVAIISFTQDGVVVQRSEVDFSIDSGKTFSTTVSFTPSSIGTYTVVTRLLDTYQTTVYDFHTEDINVISDVGPFDVSIQPLAQIVTKGQLVPFSIDLKNMGQQGLDAQVDVSVDCLTLPDINSTFVIFVANQSESLHTVSLPVCQEVGLHAVQASVIVFGKTWISSSSQFFINATTNQVEVSLLPDTSVQSGNSVRFSIQLTNPNNFGLYGLEATVTGIPDSWISIQPPTIPYLEPNGKAIFLVTVSPPINAPPQSYPLNVYIGSNSGLTSAMSTLSVLAGPTINQSPTISIGPVQDLISQNWYIIVGVIIAIVAIILIRKLRNRPGYRYESSPLSKIRGSLR